MTLGPFYAFPDHDLDGYGGTWLRRWRVGFRVGPYSIGLRFSVSRFREVGR